MSARATVGKVLMAAAVLVPAMVIAALIVRSHVTHLQLDRHGLTTWLGVDAAVLLLGLMLNRGDDL